VRSGAVLDAYVAVGGNFIDTANSCLFEHGRSESIIGRWMADRGNRDEIVVATKVGGGRGPVRNLRAVLDPLDEGAANHDTPVAAVALAWLRTRPRVVAPIVSVGSTQQLEQIAPAATLQLATAELDRLSQSTQTI
jgi:aryl-alcohol dehydrogenase-like predicted oxidoreductase